MALVQLIGIGMRAALAKAFGQYTDRRESFAIPASDRDAEEEPPFYDHSSECTIVGGSSDDPYWFDFVADVGDGFAATYTVAERLAAPHFVLDHPPEDGTVHGHGVAEAPLPRGRLLIMGGDQVYPLAVSTPERDAYLDRTVGPYEAALQYVKDPAAASWAEPVLSLYAIPGNHDWYDGLGAFVKQFCTRQWVGAWQTRQRRSYFAIKLPHDWWLWGIDVALEGPMDDPQLQYFRRAADEVKRSGGRIILCSAYPRWLYARPHRDGPYGQIRGFLHKTLGDDARRVRLLLAGDKHFYARYSPAIGAVGAEASVKIASGGGGAFLSGTQDLDRRIALHERRNSSHESEYELGMAWPPQRTARTTLALGAFRRVWRHWSFSLLVAALYLLLATILRVAVVDGLDTASAVRGIGRFPWPEGLQRLAERSIESATFWIFVFALGVGLAALALKWQRGEKLRQLRPHWAWGFAHAALHVGCAFAITASALRLGYTLADGADWGVVIYYTVVIAGGYLIGTLVYVCYLVVAQLRDRSVWALFPLLGHEGWKNFLRVAVTRNEVSVYALGVERVPRKRTVTWSTNGEVTVSEAATEWRLVDHVRVLRDA